MNNLTELSEKRLKQLTEVYKYKTVDEFISYLYWKHTNPFSDMFNEQIASNNLSNNFIK
jgi:hypothetical protein